MLGAESGVSTEPSLGQPGGWGQGHSRGKRSTGRMVGPGAGHQP